MQITYLRARAIFNNSKNSLESVYVTWCRSCWLRQNRPQIIESVGWFVTGMCYGMMMVGVGEEKTLNQVP